MGGSGYRRATVSGAIQWHIPAPRSERRRRWLPGGGKGQRNGRRRWSADACAGRRVRLWKWTRCSQQAPQHIGDGRGHHGHANAACGHEQPGTLQPALGRCRLPARPERLRANPASPFQRHDNRGTWRLSSSDEKWPQFYFVHQATHWGVITKPFGWGLPTHLAALSSVTSGGKATREQSPQGLEGEE